jgi:hypothetical protein
MVASNESTPVSRSNHALPTPVGPSGYRARSLLATWVWASTMIRGR